MQRFQQRVKRKFGHARLQEGADGVGGDEHGDATIGGMCAALDEALFDEPVDDASHAIRVEHVQPARGAKLRRIFDRIRWSD